MSHAPTPAPLDADLALPRRAVTAAAAWTVPVVAIALATPSAAASTVDVGAFQLSGTCGTLGLLGPGFLLTAGPTAALPAGTTVTVSGTGVANIGVFSVTGGTANVAVLSSTSRQITLTAPLQPGTTLAMRTTLSISVAFSLNAVSTLPQGYAATGAKPAGFVSSTLILCSAA